MGRHLERELASLTRALEEVVHWDDAEHPRGRTGRWIAKGTRVTIHGRHRVLGLRNRQGGTVTRSRYNRWYGQREYQVKLDAPPPDWDHDSWLFAGDLDPLPARRRKPAHA